MISLLVSAGNQQARDRAMWEPLLTAVEHHAETLTEDTVDGFNSGRPPDWSATTSRCGISPCALGRRERLVGAGEDTDAGEDHWVSVDEATACRYYQQHRPKRR